MIHVLFSFDPIEDKSSQFYCANVNKDRNHCFYVVINFIRGCDS